MKNQKTMLIDCHAHTSGISRCCRRTAEQVIDTAQGVGIDGIVLTNHYHMPYVTEKNVYADAKAMARAHIDEFYRAKELGDACGFKVIFGVELSMELYGRAHMLIYGIDEDFLMNNAEMAYYTQERLHDTVRSVGGAIVQAHPMRNGKNVLLDLGLMDGLEISSHILYDGTHYGELSKIAYDNALTLTSGGDFHGDTSRSLCGMYLPTDITDSKKLAEYLLSSEKLRLLMQEAEGKEPHEEIFTRKNTH